MATAARKYDLYSDAFRAETYATFARMRDQDPVICQPGIDGETPIWWVTRYDDAEAVLRDDERFVRDPRLALPPEQLREGLPEFLAFIDSNMLNRDGDDHTRLRRLVSKAFTPRMIERLRPRIQEIADALIDPVSTVGEMELVSAFAFPLPITVIAELLGVPAADRTRFREWSAAMVTPALAAAEAEQADASLTAFVEYLLALFSERRQKPGEDLVSALVVVEDGGDTLSEEELCSMVALLIVAGHETTVSLIGNATLALLTHPEQRSALEQDPSLLPRAVEELIRYDGPVERTLNRWAAEDVELRGHTIRRGDLVIVVVGAADRDPERFENPDTLDLAAGRKSRHLGFGRGPHFCLGAPLARLEAEIALGTLLRRLPGLRLAIAEGELRWRPVPLFRSLVALPVAWDA
ncbi:MAG TPA: cytochrome P450 [Gaiellaceae bacterium]|jgi:cytochrome P450|nr:cytochrome P450 [Gaiellaceae bacterium]